MFKPLPSLQAWSARSLLTGAALLAIAGLSFGALAVALHLQVAELQMPCPLCILQRYAYFKMGGFALLALLVMQGFPRIYAALMGLAALSGLFGLIVALRHMWVLTHPSLSCGRDPLEAFLNQLPAAQVWPLMFKADGLCGTPYPPLWGLDLPVWSAIGFAGLLILLAGAWLIRAATDPSDERP